MFELIKKFLDPDRCWIGNITLMEILQCNMYISTTHLAGGWCWGASHQRSSAVGARGAADQALAEAVGVEHVSARRDPSHVHRLQAHRTRGPRLLQLLLTRTRHSWDPALRWSPGWAV